MKHIAPVTVVIPAHKASATLDRTLASVAAAKPQAAEVIVVMDGHDEPTQAVVAKWPHVKLLSFAENRGACAARNLGLADVTTPYVMFLDADDCISPGLLGHLAWTAQNDEADLAFASHAIEQANGKLTMVEASKLKDARQLMDYWLSGKFVPPCSVLWNTEFMRHLGGWDESLAQNQDGDVIHRALYGGARVSWSRAGYGIYVQRNSNTRVSKMMSQQAIASQFQVLERVERMNATSGLLPNEHIGKAWYLLARRLYGRDETLHAAKALKRSRELGFKGHAGTLQQRLAAYLFGLELNTKIMRQLRKTAQQTLKLLPTGVSNKA
jgi:glycosyltransferase involved in cell wall biosynthesis